MTESIGIVSLLITIFVSGIAVGKLIEKIERFFRDVENTKNKNNRR